MKSLPPRERRLDPLANPWNVPLPQNRFFTGREGILSQLRDTVASEGRAALSGLGGMGKTQIAVQYAYKHRDEYGAVLWSQADSRDKLASGFNAIARLLDLPAAEEKDQSLIVAAVKRWLEDHSDWLLVFDNADKPELVKDFLPPAPKGHTLFTSRAQVFQTLGIAKPIEVEEMQPEEALEFLFKRSGREDSEDAERSAAEKLAHELDYLPLALEQAAAYITELGALFQDYLVSYRSRRLELLEESRPVTGHYRESVATTWLMNFEQVEKASQASADLLRVSAFLSPDSIPLELLTEGASELGPALASALAGVEDDPLLLDKVLEPLTRYSLVRRDLDSRTYSIHRLVQEVIRDEMDEDTRRLWAERVVRGVNRAFPPLEYASWPLIDRLLPHAKRACELIEQWNFGSEDAARLPNQTAYYLYDRAQYADAEPLFKRALAIWEKALGPEHPSVATSLNNLAAVYKAQGKYAEAEPLFKRALAIDEKAYGPKHPEVAPGLNNLADLYCEQGKYAEAEPLYKRALTILEKALRPEHADVAKSLNNLGELYRLQGRHAEAEPLHKQALAIREEALGPQHPDVAQSLNNLAGLYQAQGKYAEAGPLYKRALPIYEKALGPEHPDVAISLNNLAELYRVQGKLTQAEPLYERALAIREKALGAEHPHVATGLNNLALVYHAQGRYAEAEPLFKRALTILEKALGPEHPNVATCLDNYAGLLHKMGRDKEAKELETRAKAIRAKWEHENPTE